MMTTLAEPEKIMASKYHEEPGACVEGRAAEGRGGPEDGRAAEGAEGGEGERSPEENSSRFRGHCKEGRGEAGLDV